MKPHLGVWPVAALLLASGACALVYQTAWFRELRLVFGGSTAATAAVTAIFMGGLGLGNALLGKLAERSARPLAWYARLEAAVAIGAALSPLLVDLARLVYRSTGGQEALGPTGATAVRLALATLVLGTPAFLMGGTLPAAAIAVSRADDPNRRRAALLYALNTLGAVVGTLVTTFFLLEYLGVRSTIWLAAALNLGVAAVAYLLAPNYSAEAIASVAASPPPRRVKNPTKKGRPEPAPEPVEAPITAEQRAWVYGAAFVAGFAFMLMELVWFRMLAPVLGGSTFTFGLILAVALLGIGLGGALYPLLYARRSPTLVALAASCAAEALCLIAPFAPGDEIAIAACELFDDYSRGFRAAAWDWFVIAALVVGPAAIVSGVQFPLFVALLGRGGENVGEHVGRAYAWNTFGAILGSLAGGFGALPFWGAPTLWRLVAGLLLVASLLLVARAYFPARRGGRLVFPLALAAIAGALLWSPGPTAIWRHTGIGAGRALMPDRAEKNAFHRWQNNERGYVVWEADGVEASLAITASNGLAFVVNGKTDGNALTDCATQVMCGLLGAILHPEPKSALVVGLGTGQTAGWLAAVPSMTRVDVVEIEPAVDEMARRAAAANHDVLNHPKVNRIYNDAREAIAVAREKYDVISSEPSNPYRAGISSLFTREFYADVKSRLNPGGLFVQFLQGYEIDRETFRTVLATLRSEFAHVEIWQSYNLDVEFVCSNELPSYSIASLRAQVEREPYKTALPLVWRTTTAEGVLSRFVASASFVDSEIKDFVGRENTDDFNRVEYGFVRTLGQRTEFSIAAVCEEARLTGADRPPLADQPIDWNAVNDERRVTRVVEAARTAKLEIYEPEQRLRATALDLVTEHAFAGGVATWEEQSRAPQYWIELALMGLAYAELGDRKAEPLLDKLQTVNATEAALIRGVLLWNTGRRTEAPRVLADAFVKLRGLPFVHPSACARALRIACMAAVGVPDGARTILPSLSEPFVVGLDDRGRKWAGCLVAAAISDATAAPWIEAFEPHPLWTEPALKLRARVYESVGHPLAGRADQELREFLANGDQ